MWDAELEGLPLQERDGSEGEKQFIEEAQEAI